MKSFYFLMILLLSISTQIFGRISLEDNLQKLSQNDISIIDKTKTYTDHQYYLLSSFDFNSYRNYSTKRIVQIEDGPLIELTSIADMIQKGKTVSDELLEIKKNEIIDSKLKSLVTLINIGFRYGPKKNTETGF